MTKRLALLLAAALAACQPVLPSPAPPVTAQIPGIRDGDLLVQAQITGHGAGSRYHVAFALGEVSKVVVGIFDRATHASTVPSLGYFNANGAGNSTTNPLSGTEFSALQAALGTAVSVGSADETDPRRYLFKTINSPSTTTPTAVTLTNFPTVSAAAPVHLYNVFVCALDSYGTVIGYVEQDLDAATLASGTVSLSANLDYGGLGSIDATSTTSGSEFDPLANLEGLLIGTFDTSSTPNLGWLNDGTNAAFGGSTNWFAALQEYLTAQGMTDVTNTRRYLIRKYNSVVAAGARTTTSASLPVGSTYRTFIMAVRDMGVDAGHAFAGSAASVTSGSTTTVAMGAFSTGWIKTLVGDGTATYAEGVGTAAKFFVPQGVFVDATTFDAYVADTGNHKIRKVSQAGSSSIVSGSAQGYQDSANGVPLFNSPAAVVKDSAGNLFVADTGNHCIRKIAAGSGVVTTFAGNGTSGNVEGTGTNARLNNPTGLAIDASDNLYVADKGAHNIKKVTPAQVVTILAGDTSANPVGAYVEDSGSVARFSGPCGVAVTAGGGTVYVADTGNNRVRKIVTGTGTTSLIAGNGSTVFADANGSSAGIKAPWGVTFDTRGILYVSDSSSRLRRINTSNDVTTFAGNGSPTWADGDLTAARVNFPAGLAIDASNSLYVADSSNHRIRIVR